jgi:copper oxidase (laccase) domain-containing protein
LAALGLSQVDGGAWCTAADPVRFFSHRRDQRTGRMAALLWC